MSLTLLGLGSALPRHDAAQADTASFHVALCALDGARERVLRALYRRSGVARRGSVLLARADGPVEERQSFFRTGAGMSAEGPTTGERMAVYEREAPRLAVPAARRALRAAGLAPDTVTHLVTVSCTGFMAPGVDWHLVRDLGLSADVERTHVGFMGCHGSLNAVRVGDGYAGADPHAVILVCSVELCSLHFAYGWDPDMLVANALFSDGAAALVGVGSEVAAPAREAGWRVAATGSTILPGSEGDMTWRIGSHGFRMTLTARVPEVIERELRGWLCAWLAGHGLRPEDVRTWAVHPGGPRIVDAVGAALDLDPSSTAPARALLREHGNMSSATVLVLLERLRSAGAPRPCVALAFGPGLAAEAVLLT